MKRIIIKKQKFVTNRRAGNRASSVGEDNSIKRPALRLFWENLQKQLIKVKKFTEIKFPEYELAWNEWKSQLECIEKDEDKLSFLRCLEIDRGILILAKTD